MFDTIDHDRDAEIARHTAEVWHDLRSNGRAREANTNRPLPTFSAVGDLEARIFDHDDLWLERCIALAAKAEQNATSPKMVPALHEWYVEQIATEVCNAVRAAVKAEAESREANEERVL